MTDPDIEIDSLSRPYFNELLKNKFEEKGWESQPSVFDERGYPSAKMDFLKERIGIEVGFGHASFIGIDLLKFQIASYSGLDKIDVGIYVVTTKNFQKKMKNEYKQNWEGSLSFEKNSQKEELLRICYTDKERTAEESLQRLPNHLFSMN